MMARRVYMTLTQRAQGSGSPEVQRLDMLANRQALERSPKHSANIRPRVRANPQRPNVNQPLFVRIANYMAKVKNFRF